MGVTLTAEELQRSDCVVIVADHSVYDWESIVANARAVVDTRNATRSVIGHKEHVHKLGDGSKLTPTLAMS